MGQLFYGYQTYEDQDLAQYPYNTYPSYSFGWHWHTYSEPSGSAVVAYYGNLLIIQYHGKPKAKATVESLVEPVVMDLVPQQVENAFQIGSAAGVQLDTIGTYVGVTRSGVLPNGQTVTLGDLEYTQLVNAAVVRNNAGSSLARIQELLAQLFPDQIRVFDHETMRLSYYVFSDGISPDVAALFVVKGLLPKPLGVAIAVVYAPLPILGELFGMRTYDTALDNKPLNTYDDYQLDWPFLTYQYALVP